MNRTRRKEFLEKLNQEIKNAQETAQKRKKAAKEFAGASRSQQGDRLYFEDANHLAQNYLSRLLALKKELASSRMEKTLKKVKSVSFVTIEYQGGHTHSFYFTTTGVNLPGLQLVTPNSPLGKSISGKKEGNRFSYQVERDGQTTIYSGQIKKIE